MTFDIARPLPQYYEFNGRKYRLNLTFANVLNVFDLFRNDELMNYEKAQFAITMLFDDTKNLPQNAIDTIFEEYISISKKSDDTKLKIVDFRQDSIYIYSSFMADYGIDLFDRQKDLHWWKFVSLFQGLSEKTKMREVMSIRSRPLPEANKYNQKEIANLIELKQYYALDISQDEREQNFKRGIARLAENLKQKAGG